MSVDLLSVAVGQAQLLGEKFFSIALFPQF